MWLEVDIRQAFWIKSPPSHAGWVASHEVPEKSLSHTWLRWSDCRCRKLRFFHICSQPNQIKMPKKETFGSVIYLAYNPILIFSLSENCCLRVIIIKDCWAFFQIKTRLGGILFLVKNKFLAFFSSFKTFLVITFFYKIN